MNSSHIDSLPRHKIQRQRRHRERFSYTVGTLVSLVVHLVCAFIAILVLEKGAATATRPTEVFSVTLEGGENLGGFSQAPKEEAKATKKPKEIPDSKTPEAPPETEVAPPEPVKEEKKLVEPSVVEDIEKKAAEEKALQEQIKLDLKKKSEEEKKKQAEADKKEKEEAAKKKAEEQKIRTEQEAKQRAEQEKQEKKQKEKQFEQRLNAIRRGITQRYDGESANAGGRGIGAAKLGGTGSGGGTLISVEKLAFLNALENHVKSGWHWIMGADKLSAVVRFQILPTGDVQNVRLEQSSGNSNFDESAIRAVRKASPVPVPPAKFYNELSDVRIIFDSKQ